IDVRYVIRPNENFVKQVMAYNKRKQQTEQRTIKHGMIDHGSIDEPQRKGKEPAESHTPQGKER
ncbi:hypothetical protein CR087_27075, partial [Salmonella enterica subsp. enterica serovar Dublin]